jgi:hypothetical protein
MNRYYVGDTSSVQVLYYSHGVPSKTQFKVSTFIPPTFMKQHARRDRFEAGIPHDSFYCSLSLPQPVFSGQSNGQVPPFSFTPYLTMLHVSSLALSQLWDFLTTFFRTSQLSNISSIAIAYSKMDMRK